MRPRTMAALAVAMVAALMLMPAGTSRGGIVDDLENHYTFDDPSDPTRDASLPRRDGTNNGAIWVNDPVMGGAMDFQTSDFIRAELPDLNTSGEFTIAMWANIDSLHKNRGLFQVQQGGTEPSTSPNAKTLGGWVGPAGTIWGRLIDTAGVKNLSDSGPPTLTPGEWIHIAYIGDGGSYYRIVNGVPQGPDVSYNGTLQDHDRIFLARQGTESALGRLDDVRVYSRVLGDAELTTLIRMVNPGTGVAVDFGRDPTHGGGPGGTQAGFEPFEFAEGGGNPPRSLSFASQAGSDGTVDVTIAGYTHFRDYEAVTGVFADQGPLLSDMVLRNRDGTLTLTLDDLLPGLYSMETWHHSTQFGGGDFDLAMRLGGGAAQTLFTGVPVTGGPNPNSISTLSFRFETDGSPVHFEFMGGADREHLSLNGFRVTRVPEPTTLALLGLGVAGAAWRRRRR
ncbi:MAG: LamG-like jellyroll fold domain-containing protein, partial [Planctomycetota bacterium]